MKSLLPLFPFVAALSLLACQGDDGPVAEGATVPSNAVVGDASATGLAAPANAAAAEAIDQAAVPVAENGMGWTSAAAGSAHYGPHGARDDAVKAAVQRALGLEQFVAVLQSKEKPFGHAEIARQAQVKLGVDRLHAVDDKLDARRFNLEVRCKRLDGQP